MSGVTPLWAAYLALAVGLMAGGAILGWLGLRPPPGPAPRGVRLAFGVAALLAVAGAVAVAVLEAGAVYP